MKFQAYALQDNGLSAPMTRDIPFTQVEAAVSMQRLLNESVIWHWHDSSAIENVLSNRTSRNVLVLVMPDGKVTLINA